MREQIGIVVQARTCSTRLPGKVLQPIGGVSLLERLLRRMKMATETCGVVVATGDVPDNQPIIAECQRLCVTCVVGPEDDCLQRIIMAAEQAGFNSLVRVTADNPLIDPWGIDEAVQLFRAEDLEYLDNIQYHGYPHGAGCEVVSTRALQFSRLMWSVAENLEHVTWAVRRHLALFKHRFFHSPNCLHRPAYRFSVDHEEDLEVVRRIYQHFRWRDDIRLDEIVAFLDGHPEIVALNALWVEKLPTPENILAWQLETGPGIEELWKRFNPCVIRIEAGFHHQHHGKV